MEGLHPPLGSQSEHISSVQEKKDRKDKKRREDKESSEIPGTP